MFFWVNILVCCLVSIISLVIVFCNSLCQVMVVKLVVRFIVQWVFVSVCCICFVFGRFGSVRCGVVCNQIEVLVLCCVGNQIIDGSIVVLLVKGVNCWCCLMLFCSMYIMVLGEYRVVSQGVMVFVWVVFIVIKIRLKGVDIVIGLVCIGLGIMILFLLVCSISVEWVVCLQIIGVFFFLNRVVVIVVLMVLGLISVILGNVVMLKIF